jgi:PKD repeat protein
MIQVSPNTTGFMNDSFDFDGTASWDYDGAVVSWEWDFGDGQYATGPFVAHRYPNKGSYDVTLTVTDNEGASNATFVNISIINRPPVAEAGRDQNFPRKSLTVFLNGSASIDPDGDPITFAWTQSAGLAVVINNDSKPIADFFGARVGTYVFQLEMDDGDGGQGIDNVNVTLGDLKPVAILTVTPNPVGLGISALLNASASYDLDGRIVAYNFSFGDGNHTGNITAPCVSHAWSSGGSYQASVAVTDDDGNVTITEATVSVVVDEPPEAVAAVWPVSAGYLDTVFHFESDNSTDDNGIVAMLWSFGDGSNATTSAAAHAYGLRGVFTVYLTVWDAQGQNDTDALSITVLNRPPVARIGLAQTTHKRDVVTLDGASSSDPDMDALAYLWSQASGPNVLLAGMRNAVCTFRAEIVGTYVFELAVSDGHGGTDSDAVNVTVYGLPPMANLRASASTGEVGQHIVFNGTGSNDSDGNIVDYAFDFGDGTSPNGTLAILEHSYNEAGIFEVILTVRDDDGNTSTTRLTVTIVVIPANWKSYVAVIFTIILAIAGLWSSKRRPWKGGTNTKAVLKAFTIVTVPFILAESATGVVSLLTGWLSIPPAVGIGTIVDLIILLAGLGVAILRALKAKPSKA